MAKEYNGSSDSCFVCATPYQIIAAVSIAHTFKKKADLYIIPDFSCAEEYCKRISNLGIFSRVSLIDISRFESYRQKKSRMLYGLGFFFNYLRVNRIVNTIVGDADYKEIYISTHHNIGKFICIYFQKRGAEVIFYDDGEGSYDNPWVYQAFGLEKFVRTLFFGKKTVEFSKNRMLYSPELFVKEFGDSYNVTAIPNWSKDNELLRLVNLVCGYNEKARIDNRFILLDTIPSSEFDSNGQLVYEQLIDKCVEILGKDLIIKKHPRDNRIPKSGCEYYAFSDIPFEVICANSDIENKVLLSSSSTAIFTPKMLFDLEPDVIMLRHIAGGNDDNSKRDRFASHIRDLYRDKDKFTVPETIDELTDVLESLKLG